MDILCWKDLPEERNHGQHHAPDVLGENIMVTKWTLAPDTIVPTHEHESEQVTMVQSGSVTLLFPEGEEYSAQGRDMLVIPSAKPHGAKAGPQGCLALDLFPRFGGLRRRQRCVFFKRQRAKGPLPPSSWILTRHGHESDP